MDTSNPISQFVTTAGGVGVGGLVAWAVLKKKFLLGREGESLNARIAELIAEREVEKREHATEVADLKAQIERLMSIVLRSVNNNERLQNTNERAMGVVAQVVQAGTSEVKP